MKLLFERSRAGRGSDLLPVVMIWRLKLLYSSKIR